MTEGATISAGGERVAFASFAGNLFFGDANRRADAFVATRLPDPEGGTPEEGPAASGPDGTIEVDGGGPRIAVRATAKAGGVIELTVSVPAAGGVKAVAKGRAGAPAKPRTLATASGRAQGVSRSSVALKLRPVARYRPELRARGSLPARVLVEYVAARGGRRASASLRVTFRQSAKARMARGKGKR